MKRATASYTFSGFLTAESPLTVNRHHDNFSSETGTKKLQRLPRMGPKNDGVPVYFPATSIKPKLRRRSVDLVRRALMSENSESPFSLNTHFMLVQGVDVNDQDRQDKSEGMVVGDSHLRAANPILSLYGRWRLPGAIAVGNAIPMNDAGVDESCLYIEGTGTRTNDFLRNPELVEFLSNDDVDFLEKIVLGEGRASAEKRTLSDQVKALKRTIRKSVGEEKKLISRKIETLEKEIKEIGKKKVGPENSIQHPLEGFEAIMPGTRMQQRITLTNVVDAELGLFIDTLREFARDPYLGAHRSYGCGAVSGEWTVSTWPEDKDEPVTFGMVKFDQNGFNMDDPSKILNTAVATWRANLSDGIYDFNQYLVNTPAQNYKVETTESDD